METDERAWNRPEGEREALIAKAREWEGTQREFAVEHGITQSTVSKWRNAATPRTYSAEDRAAVVDGFASFEGSQREHDDALGLPRGTTGKWVSRSRTGTRPPCPPLVLKSPPPRPAPAFLEVVPVGASGTVARPLGAAPRAETAVAARLVLGGGVALVFDTLPPASWIAELAAGLRSC